jgi:hypothetical protein
MKKVLSIFLFPRYELQRALLTRDTNTNYPYFEYAKAN